MAIAIAGASERELEVARGVENLDAIVRHISDIDILAAVHGDSLRNGKLTIATAAASEFELEVAGGIEHLYAIISIINDVDVLAVVYGDAKGREELTIARATAPKSEFEIARGVEDLDAIVVGISHIEVLIAIDSNAERIKARRANLFEKCRGTCSLRKDGEGLAHRRRRSESVISSLGRSNGNRAGSRERDQAAADCRRA